MGKTKNTGSAGMGKHFVSVLCNTLGGIIVGLMILLGGAILTMRLIGFLPLSVMSGSMEPTYPVGSVILIDKNVSAEDIEAGDAIAYSLSGRATVTHRAVFVDKENQRFITKGDANTEVDATPVPFGSFIGRAVFHIPFAGRLLVNMYTPKGLVAGAVLLGMLVLLFTLPTVLSPKTGDNDDEDDDSEGASNHNGSDGASGYDGSKGGDGKEAAGGQGSS
ncbi:MAG: signal peptidase I [Clostridiales Family XIII bacterium]|jgi:signal peptidase|nr:signal peptidase I [Clostridiales Family XIII bacterium]